MCARVQRELGAVQLERHGVQMRESSIAEVDVRIFTPEEVPVGNRDRVLLNLHGGGFTVDAGSVTENAPVAAYARMTVIAARYRLAPEHPFPAAVDDAEAVYRALVAEHAATEFFFRPVGGPTAIADQFSEYVSGGDRLSPQLSPIFSDLKGLPPTLCIAGTRDFMLSQTALFHQALLRSGVDARLLVFEAMPHAHWIFLDLPESDQAFRAMANFFERNLVPAVLQA
jgi:epsilon-lactone hydrolase